jgi:hypothetical protein
MQDSFKVYENEDDATKDLAEFSLANAIHAQAALVEGHAPVVAALATVCVIADIATVSYPEGYHSPNPDLNQT